MSLSLDAENLPGHVRVSVAHVAAPPSTPGYQLIRRNGAVTPFDASKIAVALAKGFLAVEGSGAAASRRVHDIVAELTDQIVAGLSCHPGSAERTAAFGGQYGPGEWPEWRRKADVTERAVEGQLRGITGGKNVQGAHGSRDAATGRSAPVKKMASAVRL